VRDLVHPATLAGVMAGASVVLVEAHPNPLIAKSDGHQGLFEEQLVGLVRAARETWRLSRELDRAYLPSADLEKGYLARMDADKRRFFTS
jgi:3-deoxy-D-manno-octulosonic acid (KDO) 8-phosphate synthase